MSRSKKNSKTGGKAQVGDLDSRGISGFGAAGLSTDWDCTIDGSLSFSPTETRAPTETDKGVGSGSHQLWLPASSRSTSARRMADQPQAGLSTLQRGRAGAQAEEAQATEKRHGSSGLSGSSQSKRTVGNGLHA